MNAHDLSMAQSKRLTRRTQPIRFKNGRLNPAGLRAAGLSGKLHMVECPGEAHSNPHIDNCGICMPRWGEVEVPVEHADLDAWRDFYAAHRDKP